MIETLFQIKTNGRKVLLNFNTYCLDVLNYSSMRSNCFIRAYNLLAAICENTDLSCLQFLKYFIMRFRVIEPE